jgi:hypothetical protein
MGLEDAVEHLGGLAVAALAFEGEGQAQGFGEGAGGGHGGFRESSLRQED